MRITLCWWRTRESSCRKCGGGLSVCDEVEDEVEQ